MKKFEIKDAGGSKWLVPKFTCIYEDKRFNDQSTIKGLSDSTVDHTDKTGQ